MSLDSQDKQQIIQQFMNTMSSYIRKHQTGWYIQQRMFKHSFYTLIPKNINHFSQSHIKSKLRSALNCGHLCHLAWTVYDAEELCNNLPKDKIAKKIRSEFYKRIMLIFTSDEIYRKMASVGNSITPHDFLVPSRKARGRHIGFSWMAVILVLSLVIPNYPINFVGLAGIKSLQGLLNFCAYQLKNLFNTALIGRVLINVIFDIPLYHHFFRD